MVATARQNRVNYRAYAATADSSKSLGRRLGSLTRSPRSRRRGVAFDRNAEDRDGDKIVQEDTEWERPAAPDVAETVDAVSKVLSQLDGGPPRKRVDKIGKINDGSARKITNPKIKTVDDAVDHIDNGGSLDEVPNEFWLEALEQTSSDNRASTKTPFYRLPPNGGAIGDTRIYLARDSNGNPVGQGWVLKGVDADEGAREIAAQHLMVQIGLPVEGAGWDGEGEVTDYLGFEDTKPYVILPFAQNLLPDGSVARPKNGAYNYDEALFDGLPDRGAPQRVAHLLANFIHGTSDRHYGNGLTYTVDGKPYAIPIDMSWGGDQVEEDLQDYMQKTIDDYDSASMDMFINVRVQQHLQSLDEAEAKKQAQAIADTYDGIVQRAEAMLAEGKESFMKKVTGGVMSQYENSASEKLSEQFDVWEQQIGRLRTYRTRNLSWLMPRNLWEA